MVSVEDLFLASQETYAQAQLRAQEENKAFARTEFFRMDKLGVYRLRVMPIAPAADGVLARPGYEFPVHQLLLELEKPSTGGKAAYLYVTVPRATDAGYPLDLIDIYRKAAVAEAKALGDDKLAEKIGGGSFGGGLKYSYGHALYVLDLDERAKGLQLLTLSHSQFKDLDERKFKLWQKKLAKNPSYPCPISSIRDAYPVEIEKKKNGGKTEYLVSIDNESDADILSKEELAALMSAPRIPEVIYRYSRYQAETTVEYLKQCDARYGMSLMEGDEMKEAVATLMAALPKEDTSSFSFDKRTKDNKENPAAGAATLDDLFERFESLQAEGLGDRTEQGQELRGLIRAYIEQEGLQIRVTRSTSNKDLLEMIEEAMQGPVPSEEEEPDTPPAEEEPRRRRR
ncbi:MAG: hypothetical protein NC226_09920 [Bacteroides cellulosilyticus]|nr:hypothetical protein [Bacteroides cellulosilyticus]